MAKTKEQALDDLIVVRNKVKDLNDLLNVSDLDFQKAKEQKQLIKDKLDAAKIEYKAAEKEFRATPNE